MRLQAKLVALSVYSLIYSKKGVRLDFKCTLKSSAYLRNSDETRQHPRQIKRTYSVSSVTQANSGTITIITPRLYTASTLPSPKNNSSISIYQHGDSSYICIFFHVESLRRTEPASQFAPRPEGEVRLLTKLRRRQYTWRYSPTPPHTIQGIKFAFSSPVYILFALGRCLVPWGRHFKCIVNLRFKLTQHSSFNWQVTTLHDVKQHLCTFNKRRLIHFGVNQLIFSQLWGKVPSCGLSLIF